MGLSLREVGIGIGTLVVGGVVGYLLGRIDPESVPPPPLQSVTFSAPKDTRTPSKIVFYTWFKSGPFPVQADRGDETSWTGHSFFVELEQLDPADTTLRWGFKSQPEWRNVTAVAFVVTYPPETGKPSKVVNFTPNGNPVSTDGISSVHCIVSNANGAVTTEWAKGNQGMSTGQAQADDTTNP